MITLRSMNYLCSSYACIFRVLIEYIQWAKYHQKMLTLNGEVKSIGICAPGSLSCIPKSMSINLDY